MSLFRRDQGTGGVEDDLATHLLAQDLIYVGGGNVVSMLGAWRAHGLDAILRKAWRKGIVLCGPSAGSLCWFARGAERLPRRAAAACADWACCRTPTASTTTPSPRGAPSTTASSATACAPDSRSRTAWRCTSARTRLAARRQLTPRRARLPRRAGEGRRRGDAAATSPISGADRGRANAGRVAADAAVAQSRRRPWPHDRGRPPTLG